MAQYTWHRENDYSSGIDCDSPSSASTICRHLQANNVHCSQQGARVSFGGHSNFIEIIALSMPFIGKKLGSSPAATT